MSSVEKLETEFITEIYSGPPIYPFSLPRANDLYNSVGFVYTTIDEPTINDHPQEASDTWTVNDGVYDMHYKENPLSQLIRPPENIVNHRLTGQFLDKALFASLIPSYHINII
jgi:hypothetical protein